MAPCYFLKNLHHQSLRIPTTQQLLCVIKNYATTAILQRQRPSKETVHLHMGFNPAAAGPPRHPPAAGGGGIHIVAPFTSATISSQREKIDKRNFTHIFLNNRGCVHVWCWSHSKWRYSSSYIRYTRLNIKGQLLVSNKLEVYFDVLWWQQVLSSSFMYSWASCSATSETVYIGKRQNFMTSLWRHLDCYSH